MRKIVAQIAVAMLLAAGAFAQTDKPQVIVSQRLVVGDQAGPNPIFFMSEADGPGKVVKNAPYTANATTQTTQTLADGSHIVNTTTTSLARDSEGRTRREENLPKVGNLQANSPKVVVINDPVAHTQYVSKVGSDSAHTTSSTDQIETGMNKVFIHKVIPNGGEDNIQVMTAPGRHGGVTVRRSGSATDGNEDAPSTNVTRESLGTQTIQGITAEGVRETRTIPAGAIGNEKPLVITSETWTSPDLQAVVLSKRNDPRFGETDYTLTDITRAEPDPALFQPPKDLPTPPATK